MPHAVKISDSLVAIAREAAQVGERSLSGQIEYWARIGRSVERILPLPELAALKQSGGASTPLSAAYEAEIATRVAASLRAALTTAGHPALTTDSQRPRYGADPRHPDRLVRLESDGHRTLGRMIDRVFVPEGDVTSSAPDGAAASA